MDYGIVHHFPGGTKEQYESVLAAVHPNMDTLPEDQIFHAAGTENWCTRMVVGVGMAGSNRGTRLVGYCGKGCWKWAMPALPCDSESRQEIVQIQPGLIGDDRKLLLYNDL